VAGEYSLQELAQAVQDWCKQHQILPANGQASDEITERTIRYYRTMGLLDSPTGNYTRTFSEKQKLQLIAIRIFQSQGLPLRKIRDELYGKSFEALVALEKQVGKQGQKPLPLALQFQPPMASESWTVIPLGEEFLLVSRQNHDLPRRVIDKIKQALLSAQTEAEPNESSRN
jgi:DNA-binding transcriptional MerR regulator